MLFLAGLVQAVSITPPYIRADYVPGQETQYGFYVDRAAKIDVLLQFDENPALAKYVKLIDSAPNGSARGVTVSVNLPADVVEPGPNRIYVMALEKPLSSAGISALAAIRSSITINVPYPGYYFITALSIPTVNQGETADIQLSVLNRGTNNAYKAFARIDVYDADGTTIMRSLTTETKEIDTLQAVLFDTYLPTDTIKPGSYKVNVTFYHDGGSKVIEGVLYVGTKYIEITNYTHELEQGKINKFEVEIASKWNNPILKVYSVISLEGTVAKTPTDQINPWEVKRQATYIDTTNMAFGEHDATLTVHYGDTPQEDLVTNRTVKVNILPTSAPAAPPKEEKPATSGLKLTPVTILITIIVVLVMLDLGWLLVGKLKKNGKTKEKKVRK